MIVEFLEDNSFIGAFVVNPEGDRGRLEVLAENGREMNINPARVLIRKETNDPGKKPERLKLLADNSSLSQSLAQSTNLKSLWEALEEEGSAFSYELLASLEFGREPSPDDLSAIMRAIYTDGLWFKFTPKEAVRHEMAEIELILSQRESAKKRQNLIQSCAIWITEALTGKVPHEPEDSEKITKNLTSLALGQDTSFDLKSTKELLKLSGLPETSEGAIRALTAIGEFSEHENLEFLRLGLKREFSTELVKMADELASNFKPDNQRLDLSHLTVYTIDTPGAREFDDALSLEKLENGLMKLGLHISDVAALVPKDHPLDREAFDRAASVYLPEAKYSMLPETLTENILSLRKNMLRPAFSLMVTISPDGDLSDILFTPSLIKVTHQFSFMEADEELAHNQDLLDFHRLAQIILKRRQKSGGQIFNLPQLNVYFTPDGVPVYKLTNWNTPTHFMVGEFMVLANHLAAVTLRDKGLACPFRYQEKMRPNLYGLKYPPKNEREKMAFDLAQRRLGGRSGLSLKEATHHGLGLAAYTSFTSPMRRYLDLLVARQLRAVALNQDPPYSQSAFSTLALTTYDFHRSIVKMQNNRHRYWLCQILSKKIGTEFKALVFERNEKRCRICITDIMHEYDLTGLALDIRPGMEIIVRLTKSYPKDLGLNFEFVSLVRETI